MPECEKTEEKNSEYIHDFNFFMYNLGAFGILENSGSWKKFFYSVYHKIFHFLYIFFIILFLTDAYLVRKDKEKLFSNLCTTIITTGSVFKIWALINKLKLVVELRRKFRENFNLPYVGKEKAHKEIIEKSSHLQALITKVLTAMVIPIMIIWATFPLVDPSSKEWKYCIPFPILKNAQTPIFEIMYAVHAFMLVHFVSNVVNNDLLIIGSLVRICGQFDVLIYNISKIKKIYPDLQFEKFVSDYKDEKKENIKEFWGQLHQGNTYNDNGLEVNCEDSEKLNKRKDWRKKMTLKIMRQNVVHHQCILQ